jgi:hypothetical protein
MAAGFVGGLGGTVRGCSVNDCLKGSEANTLQHLRYFQIAG